jgi:hypothetical protein
MGKCKLYFSTACPRFLYKVTPSHFPQPSTHFTLLSISLKSTTSYYLQTLLQCLSELSPTSPLAKPQAVQEKPSLGTNPSLAPPLNPPTKCPAANPANVSAMRNSCSAETSSCSAMPSPASPKHPLNSVVPASLSPSCIHVHRRPCTTTRSRRVPQWFLIGSIRNSLGDGMPEQSSIRLDICGPSVKM